MADQDHEQESRTSEEAQLLSRLAEHDEAALRALITLHGPFVYGKSLQITRNAQLAEEAAQDALLVLWWEPQRFQPERGSLRPFLIGVARNKAIDLVRHEEVIRSREALLIEAGEFLDAPPADRAVEDALVVRSAIDKLPVAKQQVIFLAYYKGLTYREVAHVLGLPEGTVKTRIRDALIRLRRLIARTETA